MPASATANLLRIGNGFRVPGFTRIYKEEAMVGATKTIRNSVQSGMNVQQTFPPFILETLRRTLLMYITPFIESRNVRSWDAAKQTSF